MDPLDFRRRPPAAPPVWPVERALALPAQRAGDAPPAGDDVELSVQVRADGRQIVVQRRLTPAAGGQRVVHIDAVVR